MVHARKVARVVETTFYAFKGRGIPPRWVNMFSLHHPRRLGHPILTLDRAKMHRGIHFTWAAIPAHS
jgi:hypothetical protein